ncbi:MULTISPECIES: IclR family transcriptional regulator C-terminal domain-containing protein [Kitasatospora]|uniref:Putative IclR family transcriptional regulator n=1 Tax=Kitasatospora setae (strain ATCC 33774 / DSM 43861 / JCM 3304 / KCC A-0304 / NBRC 14216 / KM-6054) TaxID=452652 RepID=E4N1S2_KITSK|nr:MULTISPECIES: IclR family transcriptional regulator C-terminal domain-containing protein [Kitasatospora]BAJ32106.1 putative IclR family transcriptional regulator [Kitasatospora setae KM-6054]
MPVVRGGRHDDLLGAGGGGGSGPFGTLRRALRLLEAVDRRPDGATLTELARELTLPEARLRLLAEELETEGYLARQDGRWALGGALTLLGTQHRETMVRARLHHRLEELRDELGAAVYFSRYHDGELSVEAVSADEHAPAVHEWADFRATAHASAIGKCLLAQLDHDARLDHLSRHPAARLTARTITGTDRLLHRLDRQPATVPVLDLQEYSMDTVCAAVPIVAGGTVGCLATSLPVDQAHRLREAADLLSLRAAPLMLAMAV